MLHIQIVARRTTRTQRSPIVPAIALLSLIFIPSLSSAAIYKCTAQDGGITYTDVPCGPDTKAQTIDPAKPPLLIESSPTLGQTPAVSDEESQAQPETLATLCAADEFSFWLKAQRGPLPERDVRTAKLIRFNKLCRRALHLPDVATYIPESSLKPVLASIRSDP
jgi:hypothetical protein